MLRGGDGEVAEGGEFFVCLLEVLRVFRGEIRLTSAGAFLFEQGGGS